MNAHTIPHRRIPHAAAFALTFCTCLAAATACSSGNDEDGGGGGSEGQCEMRVVYQDHAYRGAHVDGPIKAGTSLGTGAVPACNDVGEDGPGVTPRPSATDEPVELLSIVGVRPDQAVMIKGDTPKFVYIRIDLRTWPPAGSELAKQSHK